MNRFLLAAETFFVTASWLVAGLVGLGAVGAGIYSLALGNIVGGLAIVVLGAPFAFMAAQTVLGVLAVPFGVALERRSPVPELDRYDEDDPDDEDF